MEERQVTLDGTTLPLSGLFWTVATQNPLEFEGTYPLPEAQLDRFLFKLVVPYPEAASERQMLENVLAGFEARDLDQLNVKPLITVEQVFGGTATSAASPCGACSARLPVGLGAGQSSTSRTAVGGFPTSGDRLVTCHSSTGLVRGSHLRYP